IDPSMVMLSVRQVDAIVRSCARSGSSAAARQQTAATPTASGPAVRIFTRDSGASLPRPAAVPAARPGTARRRPAGLPRARRGRPGGAQLMRSPVWQAAIVFTAAAGALHAAHPSVPGVAQPSSMEIFLLAGQSNMAGRGEVADEDRQANPRVWMFDRARAWLPAVDPMHFDKPIAAVGPGRTFGIEVARRFPDANVGLVPA